MADKKCPRCPDSIMDGKKIVAIVPFMMNEKFVNVKVVSDSGGYPVQVYICPNCRLVELYQEA